MSTLTSRVETRFRAEWPGTQFTRNGELYTVPPIREGGATHAALDVFLRILREEQPKSAKGQSVKGSKYQVGDRVRITAPHLPQFGYEFVVTEVHGSFHPDGGRFWYGGDANDSGVWEQYLEPAPTHIK